MGIIKNNNSTAKTKRIHVVWWTFAFNIFHRRCYRSRGVVPRSPSKFSTVSFGSLNLRVSYDCRCRRRSVDVSHCFRIRFTDDNRIESCRNRSTKLRVKRPTGNYKLRYGGENFSFRASPLKFLCALPTRLIPLYTDGEIRLDAIGKTFRRTISLEMVYSYKDLCSMFKASGLVRYRWLNNRDQGWVLLGGGGVLGNWSIHRKWQARRDGIHQCF